APAAGSEVDTRLDQIATSQAAQLKGQAAIANARLAYQAYEEVIAGQRWQQLAGLGAQPQRPLWASNGIKNHAYSDTMYVTEALPAQADPLRRISCGEAGRGQRRSAATVARESPAWPGLGGFCALRRGRRRSNL